MHRFERLQNALLELVDPLLHQKLAYLPSPHRNQSLLWPLAKPVQSAAVYQRREHPQSGGKGLTEGTHRNHDVDILIQTSQILGKDVHFIGLQSFPQALALAGVHDFVKFFLGV